MLTKKDYILVSIIGFCFALFSIPILKGLELNLFQITTTNIILLIIFFVLLSNVALYLASIINEKIKIALQIAKFGAVGAFNTFLDWSVLNLLMEITNISEGVYYSVFKGISFLVAVVGAYFWNKYWTFNSQKETNSKEILSFSVVSIAGFFINVSIASLIVFIFKDSSITAKQLGNVGALCGTIVSLFWNFIGYKIFVFKK